MLNEFSLTLKELKKTLFYITASFITCFIIALLLTTQIIDFTITQLGIQISSLKPTDSFNAFISISFFLALTLSFPLIIKLLYSFIENALFENEKKTLKKLLLYSIPLFYFGLITGLIVSVLSLQFFSSFSSSLNLINYWGIEFVASYVIQLSLVFSLIFVLIPTTTFVLLKFTNTTKKNVVVSSFMAFPLLAFISAWITPPDLFSMIALLIPIYLLIFISLILIKKNGGN